LLVRFIKVDLGTSRIIRLRVDLQHVFHGGDKLGTDRWDAPLLLQPRLEVTFFKTRRTLSYEYDSASPSATTRSASRCKVQRLRPSGAPLRVSTEGAVGPNPCQHGCGVAVHFLWTFSRGAGRDLRRFQKRTGKKTGLAIELARAPIDSPRHHEE
jgi:hypothetical protein